MTLDDLACQNSGFYGFFGNFGLRDTFHERIAPKPIEIDMDKLRMKFSALNVDFDGPTVDFLDSRKLAHEVIKERYHRCCPVTATGFRACSNFLLTLSPTSYNVTSPRPAPKK